MRFLASSKLSEHRYKTPEGYLVCVDSVLSRTGKQEYTRNDLFNDGSDEVIEVDRCEDEVFSREALASFENKPLTIEHPDEDVNPENHNKYSVGFVRDVKRGKDGNNDVMLGTIIITDAEAIELVESGKLKELSCGYDCDIDDSDHIQQRNIKGNHVALCEHGRAGIARIVDSIKNKRRHNMNINDIKPIHENIREQIVYTMQSDVDKDLYFYIGEKYAMKEGNYTYQQYDMEGQSPEALRDELKKHGWHQVIRGKAPFIDMANTEDAPDTETVSGRTQIYEQRMMSSLDNIPTRKWNKAGYKVNIDNNRITLLATDKGVKITYEDGSSNIYTDKDKIKSTVEKLYNLKDSYTTHAKDLTHDGIVEKVVKLLKKNGIRYEGDAYGEFAIRNSDVSKVKSLFAQNNIKYTADVEANETWFYFDKYYNIYDSSVFDDSKYLVGYVDEHTDKSVYTEIIANSEQDARNIVKNKYKPHIIFESRKISDSKPNFTRIIKIIKAYDKKFADSNELKRLAYDFAEMGNYFDRANSINSRSILSRKDEDKIVELYNLGLKVYTQLKKDIDGMKNAKSTNQTDKVVWDNEISKLINDGARSLRWANRSLEKPSQKNEALAEKLLIAIKEYEKLVYKLGG